MLRQRSHHSEKPAHDYSGPHSPQLKKAATNTQHSQKWIKKKKKPPPQTTVVKMKCRVCEVLNVPERGRQNVFAKIALFVPSSNWLMLPDHLPCLLRNLYAGQEATVRTLRGTTDGFKIGKGVRQGCILLPCLFNLHAEYIIWSVTWMNHKQESRLPRKKGTSDMQMIPL